MLIIFRHWRVFYIIIHKHCFRIALLLRSMKKDQRKMMAYILYMQKSRLTLLQLDYCLEKMEKRIHRDTSLTSECFVEMLVRIYLQKKEQFLKQFVYDFQRLRVQVGIMFYLINLFWRTRKLIWSSPICAIFVNNCWWSHHGVMQFWRTLNTRENVWNGLWWRTFTFLRCFQMRTRIISGMSKCFIKLVLPFNF